VAAQGPQATLGRAARGDVVEAKGLAEGRDGLRHGHAVGLFLLGRLASTLQFLTDSSRAASNPKDSRTMSFRHEEQDEAKPKSQSRQNIPLARACCCEAMAWADRADPSATARPSARVLARAVASGSKKGDPPPPPRAKFSMEKFSTKMTIVPFDYIDSGILKNDTLNGKADRAEGLLRLWDTDTSLITFRER
jgi:hypothetical protein